MRHPRHVYEGDEYTKDEIINRVKVRALPEPEFMGEPWGISDHIPRDRRVQWSEERQTYEPIGDHDGD